mgnify:FL=1
MGYNLFICEKPSQAADLARNLKAKRSKTYYATSDDSIRVTWCLGHLLELCPPEAYDPALKSWRLTTLPIIPQKFKYDVKKKTADQYKVVSTLIKSAAQVTIATDYDREGEAIARTILERTHYKGPLQRLCLTALDDKSIARALKQIKDGQETEPLYRAAVARSQADWIVGMNLSRLFTLLTRSKGAQTLITVGRVQTPTITLVTERDQAIKNFVPQPFFEVYVDLAPKTGPNYRASWQAPEDYTDEDGHVLDRTLAEKVATRAPNHDFKVTKASNKTSNQAPMLPYDLTSLQQFCNRRFGFSAAKTLSVAQSLYEKHKATSYPRTDCRYLPNSQLADVPEILATLKEQDPQFAPLVAGASTANKPRSFNQSKITAHHAIIPTGNPKVNLQSLSLDERKVYDAVRRAYVAQFYPDAVYKKSELELVNTSYESDKFRAVSRILAEPGWRALFGAKKGEAAPESSDLKGSKANASEGLSATATNAATTATTSATSSHHREDNNSEASENLDADQLKLAGQVLPDAKLGDLHLCVNAEIKDKMTSPPNHYTEATLLSAMENIHRTITDPRWKKLLKETAGLGTPATRAQIIDSAVDREYLTRSGKYIISTDKARFMTEVIPADIRSAGMTAVWEQALDSIAHNAMDPSKFMASIERWIRHVIEENSHLTLNVDFLAAQTTTQASSQTTSNRSRSSSARNSSSPRNSSSTRNSSTRKKSSAQTPEATTKRTRTKASTPKSISTPKKATSKSQEATFSNETATQKGNAAVNCPICGSSMVLRKNRTTGEEFYGCSQYPKCHGVIQISANAKPNLTSQSKAKGQKANSITKKDGARPQEVTPNINMAPTKAQAPTSRTVPAITCPKCGAPMVLRHNKTTKEAFYGCSKFPHCRSVVKAGATQNLEAFSNERKSPHQESTTNNFTNNQTASRQVATSSRPEVASFTPCSPFFTSHNGTEDNSVQNSPYTKDHNLGPHFAQTPKQDPLDLSMYGLETNSQESPSNSAPKNKAKSSPTPPNVDPNYVPPSEDDYPW